MKSIRAIAVLSLLVLFPLVSYLYLRQGYYFRLNALKELESKTKLSEFNYKSIDPQVTYDFESLSGKTTLLYNHDVDQSKGMMDPIYNEFSHRDDFQVIGFTQDTTHLNTQNSVLESSQWKIANAKYKWDKQVTLVDSGGYIRNYYALDSLSFLSLGQHIPIILPRKKEKDIKMKE